MSILPTNKVEPSTTEGLRNFNRLTRNYVLDRPQVIIWSPHLAYEGTGITYLGSGPPALTEMNSSDVISLRFATTNTHNILWRLPQDMDPTKDLDIRAIHMQKVATSGTVTWTWLYGKLPLAGATAIASTLPATVFDTIASAQNAHTTAFAPYAQGWNTIAAGKLSAMSPGEDYLHLKVTCTLATLADADLIAVEARYYRRFVGGGNV